MCNCNWLCNNFSGNCKKYFAQAIHALILFYRIFFLFTINTVISDLLYKFACNASNKPIKYLLIWFLKMLFVVLKLQSKIYVYGFNNQLLLLFYLPNFDKTELCYIWNIINIIELFWICCLKEELSCSDFEF